MLALRKNDNKEDATNAVISTFMPQEYAFAVQQKLMNLRDAVSIHSHPSTKHHRPTTKFFHRGECTAPQGAGVTIVRTQELTGVASLKNLVC